MALDVDVLGADRDGSHHSDLHRLQLVVAAHDDRSDVARIGATDGQRAAELTVGLEQRQVEVGIEVHDGAGRGAPVGGRELDRRPAGHDVGRRQDEPRADHRALAEMFDRPAAGDAHLDGGFER